jgi:hypothetical protein
VFTFPVYPETKIQQAAKIGRVLLGRILTLSPFLKGFNHLERSAGL